MEFSYADRAKVLAEALPYIQKYSGKTVVVSTAAMPWSPTSCGEPSSAISYC